MKIFVPLIVAAIGLFPLPLNAQGTRIHGRVIDSRTAEPIGKATVSIRDLSIETRTADNGEFELTNVPPGEIELHVTTVGYALIRQKVNASASLPIELEILLGPDVSRRTDEVTVTESPFMAVEPASVSDHTLTQADMRNLTSVLIDDPLRSVQALPGVSTGDDFYAHFSARGAGFRSIGYAVDGMLLHAPMYEVGDINDGGSFSILNGDVIESITLSTGGFSSKYGDRTAGYLSITTREGNRQRFTHTGAANVSGIGWTSEGPIGSSHKASFLASARKSYLNYIIDKVSDDPSTTVIFGFKDLFANVRYSPMARHQFSLSGNLGKSRVDLHRDEDFDENSFLFGDSVNTIATGNWLWIISDDFTLNTAGSYDKAVLRNVNHDGAQLFHATPQQVALKQDATYQLSSSHKIEVGYFARHLSQDGEAQRFKYSTKQFVTHERFSGTSWQPGVYAQHTITGFHRRFAFTYGGRLDRFSSTDQDVWMPRASLAFSPTARMKVTAAFGQYSQFPSFAQLLGRFGNPSLKAERATHYTLQLEQLLTEKVRVRVEAYDREDRNGIYSADTEYRIVNGLIVGPGIRTAVSQLQNNLLGHARGVEVFVERRSVNNLSGWVSYSYGVARYRDAATNLSFDGDLDQRHTFNVYATYRLKPTLNLSTKYRYGSNFPVGAFLIVNERSVTSSEQRNRSRLPAYSRLDVRVNKAFTFDRWKLTLHGEVLNVLGRRNVRYTTQVDPVNRGLDFDREAMFPRLPLAGVRVEF